MKKFALLITAMALVSVVFSQRKKDTQKTFFGLEYKPIFTNEFFTSAPGEGNDDALTYNIANRSGGSFGMVIRHNFHSIFSIETGISQVTRNYNLRLSDDTTDFVIEDQFKLVTYEIPLLGLVYVQTGDQTFINAGAGLSFNFFPSELSTFEPGVYNQVTFREGWVRTSLLAQIGFEYRSKNAGIFYLGTSLHRPFKELAESRAKRVYDDNSSLNRVVRAPILGRFLTLSLRYFFGPSPNEKGEVN